MLVLGSVTKLQHPHKKQNEHSNPNKIYKFPNQHNPRQHRQTVKKSMGNSRDPQGHGTPETGKRDPYYSHTIPISLGILMGVVWE